MSENGTRKAVARAEPERPRRSLKRRLLRLALMVVSPFLLLYALLLWATWNGVSLELDVRRDPPDVSIRVQKTLPLLPGEVPRRLRRVPRVWRPRPPAPTPGGRLEVSIDLARSADLIDVLKLLERDARPLWPLHSAGLGTTAPGLYSINATVNERGAVHPERHSTVTFGARRSDGTSIHVNYLLAAGRAMRSVDVVNWAVDDNKPIGECKFGGMVRKLREAGGPATKSYSVSALGSTSRGGPFWRLSPEGFVESAEYFDLSSCEHEADPFGVRKAKEDATPSAPSSLNRIADLRGSADAEGRVALSVIVAFCEAHVRAQLTRTDVEALRGASGAWMHELTATLDAEGYHRTRSGRFPDVASSTLVGFGFVTAGGERMIYRCLASGGELDAQGLVGSAPGLADAKPPTQPCAPGDLLAQLRGRGVAMPRSWLLSTTWKGGTLRWNLRSNEISPQGSWVFGPACMLEGGG